MKTLLTLSALLCALGLKAQLPPTNYFTVITWGVVSTYGDNTNLGPFCIATNGPTTNQWTSYDPQPQWAALFVAVPVCGSGQTNNVSWVSWFQTMKDGVRLWPSNYTYIGTNKLFFVPIYEPTGGLPVHHRYEVIAPTNRAPDAELLYSYPPDSHPNLPWPDWRSWGSPYATVTEPDDQEAYGNNFDGWLWKSVSPSGDANAAQTIEMKDTNLGQY